MTVQDEATAQGVILTSAAAAKVSNLLTAEGRDDLRLRIAVQPGGCSGLRYQLYFDEREIDAIPGQRQLGQSREYGPRHGSPGHRDGEARLTLQRLGHTHVECGGRLGGDLVTCHAASVAQPAASRRALMLSSPTRCASELAPTTQASR